MNEREIVDRLPRFLIESIWAFDFVGRRASAAGVMTRIGYKNFHHDLTIIKATTGLNPRVPEDLDRLLAMIEKVRKEETNGEPFCYRDYFG